MPRLIKKEDRQQSTQIEECPQLGKRSRKAMKKYIDMEASESDGEPLHLNPNEIL
jgi:hypothetical protein